MAARIRPSRSLLVYLLLVVPPMGGLLAILRLGEGLAPPHSIGGVWRLTPEGDQQCASSPTPDELRVSQSGLHAEVSSDRASGLSLAVELHGTSIVGRGRASGQQRCKTVLLDAHLTGHDTLDGTLEHPGCDECVATSFHAVRNTHGEAATR